MKRYAVISDIHSNHVALMRVLEEIDMEGVDEILCAGDIVGYNSQPNQVIDEFRKRHITSIMGNHDAAAISPNLGSRMNSLASEVIRWTQHQLSPDNAHFIASLGTSLLLDELAIYHGSPLDPDEYVYEEQVDEKLALVSGKDVTVMGHTHVPFVKRISGAVVINPGSVGQPRDGDARASFAILRGKAATITRVHYDIESIVSANISAGLPLPLSERLRWGV